MVPHEQAQIAPAIDAALERLLKQVRSDSASCGPTHAEGAALLTALADSADEVRRRLAGAPSSASENAEDEGTDHE